MKKAKSFFSLLAGRTRRSPSAKTEADLFRQIDAAFSRDFSEKEIGVPFLSGLTLLRWAPLASAAVLLAVLGMHLEGNRTPSEPTTIGAWAGVDGELLAEGGDYAFYDEMEDWMLNASDEEWEQLLHPK